MNDLISRQQAIKAIEESKLEVWLNHYEHDDGYNEGLETAIEEIQELPPAQPEIIACGQGELVQDGSSLVQDGSSLVQDCISRQAAIDALRTCYDTEAVTYTNGNEYISYDQALDLICQLPPAQTRERLVAKIDVSEEQIRDALKKMRNEPVQVVPSVQPVWIPCSERLPEEGERVLATHLGGLNPNNQVIEHIYQCGEFTYGWDMDMDVNSPTFGQRYMGEVIAWMPLPEPYKE